MYHPNHPQSHHHNSSHHRNFSWQASYSLNALPLAPSVRGKLQSAGYHAVRDVLRCDVPLQLCRAVPTLTLDEARDVLKAARTGGNGRGLEGAKSAAEILRHEESKIPLHTFCEKLDAILGGGVSTGEITEFCGAPGVGKTQMCMQLACSAQIPREFSGNEGECVYIDTEGSFTGERCGDIALGTHGFLKRSLRKSGSGGDERRKGMIEILDRKFTAEKMLEKIHVFRCHEVTELLACLYALPEFITKECPNVKLIVVDSIAFHFRQDFDDMALRASILSKTTNGLMSLAKKNDLAVVTINQATTKPGGRLVPALGESYAHAATTRVALSWENENRVAHVSKSPRLANGKALYEITSDGVRDAEIVGSKRKAH